MGLKIEGQTTGGLDEKRFYMPGIVVTSTCPKCGGECVIDFARNYLSYPTAGEPSDLHFSHECKREPGAPYDDNGWDERVILRVTLEPVTP